jgi:hypothetical protein
MEEMQQYLAEEAAVCLTNPVYRGEMWLKAVIPVIVVPAVAALCSEVWDAFVEHSHDRVSTG